MVDGEAGSVADDWETVLRVLPAGWEDQARDLGALRRCREFPDAATLLRVLLIHLAEGCSLRETAVRAAEGQLVQVSDVALMKRLKSSGEWFRWMSEALMRHRRLAPVLALIGEPTGRHALHQALGPQGAGGDRLIAALFDDRLVGGLVHVVSSVS